MEFMVTTADGTVVGDANGKFVTDSAGTILIEGIDPGTTLVVKETRAKTGYELDDTPRPLPSRRDRPSPWSSAMRPRAVSSLPRWTV